jgi:hypothetical protein
MIPPAAALVLSIFATGAASAQVPSSTNDPVLTGELSQLKRDAHELHSAYGRLQRAADHCRGFDSNEVIALQSSANDVSQRAAALAPQLPGRQHASALTIQKTAEYDFLMLGNLHDASICYQP